MQDTQAPVHETSSSRRSFLSVAGKAGAAASAFMIIKPELVRGQGKERLKAGIVGCGGRGTGAVIDMLSGTENVDLVAMGDMFEDRLEGSLKQLRERAAKINAADRIKVEPDHRFMGPDSYKKVLASDIDIVMLATPPVIVRSTSKRPSRRASICLPRSHSPSMPRESGV